MNDRPPNYKGREHSADDLIQQDLLRMQKHADASKIFRDALEVYAAGQPQTITCSRHPHIVRRIDLDQSSRESWEVRKAARDQAMADQYAGLKPGTEAGWVLVYSACAECAKDVQWGKELNWLKRMGVPTILLEASLQTFRTETEADKKALSICAEFAKVRKGFLVMTGALGDGKSFLAVATLRAIGGGRYITHNDLQFNMRKGYRDPQAEDWLEKCRATKCLVLDDVGFSLGGVDDQPMLHHILDHRHNEQLPTIITSNLTLAEVQNRLGPRMEERWKQSLFQHIAFTGPSHRPRMAETYMQ